MAVKILLILAFITHVLCEKHSVTFVIDDTYSLVDDIKQVKHAAKSIMELFSEKASEIENYMLVTFNDPDIEVKKKTVDPNELIKELDSIKAHDGNKAGCLETSLSALQLALDQGRDGAYVFVFTDASARDIDKFEKVKTTCQEKKSQVYFIVSGHCGDMSSRRYQVYRDIAAACKGQAITIHRKDIAKVPPYIKELIQRERNVVDSTLIPAYRWRYVKFIVNSLTEDFIISASGFDVDLTMVKTRNVKLDYKKIVWTRNFKAFDPSIERDGVYSVKVRGNSPVVLTIMARTNFTFEHGFSFKNAKFLNETAPAPFTDVKMRLTIFVKDPEVSANVTGVELHTGSEKISKALSPVKNNVYVTEEFLSPEKPFKIAVAVIAKKTKKSTKSFAKTLVSPIKPTSVELINVKEGSSIDVLCRIPSNKTKTKIRWFKKTKEGYFNALHSETKEVLHIKKPVDQVYYKCVAWDGTGYDQYNGKIDIQVRPQLFYPPRVKNVNINENVTIECKLFKGNPPPKRTWYFKHSNTIIYEEIRNQGDTINIPSAKINDTGEYRCVASNSEGTDEKYTLLLVREPPKVLKTNDNFTIKEGTSKDLNCSIVKGAPTPVITWYSKQEGDADFVKIVGENSETLHINAAKISKTYKCIAANDAGSDDNVVSIKIEAHPEFLFTSRNVTVNEKQTVTLDCRLRKGSDVELSWERKLKDETSFNVIRHEGTQLVILSVDLEHAGEYRCIANNSEGRAEKVTRLIVRAEPVLDDVTTNITALENSKVELECRIKKGFPEPIVSWFYEGPQMTTFFYTSKTGEKLTIENVQVSNAGQYKCVAKNDVGETDKTILLVVNAPPKIVFVPPNTAKHTAVEGDPEMRVPCFAKGHPTPIITWMVDNKNLSIDICQLPAETGPCRASHRRWYYDKDFNECRQFTYGGCRGNDNRFDSELECRSVCGAPKPVPKPIPGKCKLPMLEGPCKASRKMWYFDITLKTCLEFNYGGCNGNENKFRSLEDCKTECLPPPPLGKYERIYVEDNVLVIPNPMEANSSRYHSYVCHAANEIDQVSQTYEVVITDKIQYNAINETYALYHQPYDIKCPLSYSDPSLLKWYKNGKLVPDKTGPLLHFDKPTESDSGNYTCRDSLAGTHTVQVTFGLPPRRDQTVYDVEWLGEAKAISCYSYQYPEGEYEWFYDKKRIGNKETINIAQWGEYTCNVKNPFGSLNIAFKVTTAAKGCRVPISLFTSENAPLVLNSNSSWPILQIVQDYFIIPHSVKLQLFCQDGSSSDNNFSRFPNLNSVTVKCEGQDMFSMSGNMWNISEFECNKNVVSGVKQTKIPCEGENTELMQIGYPVNGFTEVYQSCLDLKRMMPLYTKLNTIPTQRSNFVDDELIESCEGESGCCYETIQLVNAIDVSFGPAQIATNRHDDLNTVNYCVLKNDYDWYNIEKISRSEIPFVVWTGVAQYTEVIMNGKTEEVPRYLWKVLKYKIGSDEETVAIIHENTDRPGRRVCQGECDQTSLFKPSGLRTYCCSFEDFKKTLGVNIDFNLSTV